jgi:predicted phage terminase large subunit-like protein
VHEVSADFEAGRVHVPTEAHWLNDYIKELLTFPKGRHDDQVDSTAQVLDWLRKGQGPNYEALTRW